jgi:hypothetical protein
VKAVDKTVFITGLQAPVDAQLQRTVQLSRLDNELLNRPSATGGWSINQCVSHLVSYGEYYLPLLRSALLQPTNSDQASTFVGSWLGGYLTRLMNPQTGRTKFKVVKRHQPAATAVDRTSIELFIRQQNELQELLTLAKSVDIGSVRIPLSVAGWVRLPVGDILQFMVAHIERHLQQAERNV